MTESIPIINLDANPEPRPYYKKISLLKIGIPTQQSMHIFSIKSMLDVQKALGKKVFIEMIDVCPLEVARNLFVKPNPKLIPVGDEPQLSYNDYDALLMIDSDLTYRIQDVIFTMQSLQNFPIVGGCYPKWNVEPLLHQVYIWRGKGRPPYNWESQTATEWSEIQVPDNGLTIKVDRIGSGWMAIRSDVFKVFDEGVNPITGEKGIPYFQFIGRSEHGGSEDFYFCDMARALGYEIVVDSRIRVKHLRTVEYG